MSRRGVELVDTESEGDASTPIAQNTFWRLDDIDFQAVDRATVRDDWLVFKIVATASFIEAGSALYTRNLLELFGTDAELARWLAHSWKHDEMRHGAALRAYVEWVWPAFDWEPRFNAFLDAYSQSCTVSDLEPTRAQELAARCIVETGTSTLYRALRDHSREVILRRLAGLIYGDEIRHYKHFYHHFRRYERQERPSKLRLGQTLIRRLLATRSEDGRCAYRQVSDFAAGAQSGMFDADYRAFNRNLTSLVRRYVPARMLARMILKPLNPSPNVVSVATRLSAPLYGLWLSAAR